MYYVYKTTVCNIYICNNNIFWNVYVIIIIFFICELSDKAVYAVNLMHLSIIVQILLYEYSNQLKVLNENYNFLHNAL